MSKGICYNKEDIAYHEKSLRTIYKVFLRPLIDCEDIIYDKPQN